MCIYVCICERENFLKEYVFSLKIILQLHYAGLSMGVC